MLGFLILGILLISVFWRYKKFIVIGFCILFLVLGIWRYQVVESRIINNELREYNDVEENITSIGRVVKEPDIREKSTKLTIKTAEVLTEYGFLSVKGKILVTTGRYPEYEYGDELKITGKLKTPPEFEDFNYKDYLAKNGIYSITNFPEIEVLSEKNYRGLTSVVYAKFLGFKNKLRESIYQNLSPPQSSILGAMILGDKSRMSTEVKEKLNISGLRHITAVSGMHVVILTSILMSLLIGLGLWRGQAFYLTIVIIFLFIIMAGLQPSGIRAGIMGGLFLLGQKIGRKTVSSRSIIMAAVVMLAINPFLLTKDVGFQLSFLAVIGIIYLGPIFKNWLKLLTPHLSSQKGEGFGNLRSIISMTLSAQIFTLPILVYNFGRISLVAPLTNVLILPIVYWIMIFGFIFGFLGIIWQPLGWIFSLPCWLLLTYLIKIVDFFSQPWAAKMIENLHWLWLIIFYLILSIFVQWLNKKEKLKFLKY